MFCTLFLQHWSTRQTNEHMSKFFYCLRNLLLSHRWLHISLQYWTLIPVTFLHTQLWFYHIISLSDNKLLLIQTITVALRFSVSVALFISKPELFVIGRRRKANIIKSLTIMYVHKKKWSKEREVWKVLALKLVSHDLFKTLLLSNYYLHT